MQQGRRNNLLANIDWLTVFLYLVLVFMGWINIYSAVYDDTHQSIFDISRQYGKQLMWIGAAIILSIIIVLIDSKFYSTFAYVLYAVGCLLLVSVLLFGKEVNGAKSWFEIGSFRMQPVEFTKIAVCLAVARLMSSESFTFNYIRNYFRIGIILGIPMLMILLQNDTGSALVFCTFIFVMFREGMNRILFVSAFALIFLFIFALIVETSLLLLIVGLLCSVGIVILWGRNRYSRIIFYTSLILSVISIVLCSISPEFAEKRVNMALIGYGIMTLLLLVTYFISKQKPLIFTLLILVGMGTFVFSVDYIFDNVLQPHQQSRILDLLGKNEDVLGTGYNVHQSKIAIGSGGMLGKGFLEGTQTKYNFVPEQSTDFIFCTIGEEWGFAGITLILLVFGTLILRLINMAERQRSAFSRIYGYGVASILFFHVAINIGMTIGLAPVVGIPLPFFSYGGSSLWAFTILLFIFIRFDADRLQMFR